MAAGAPSSLRDRVRHAFDRMRRHVRARGVVVGLALAIGPALLWRLRVHLLAVYRARSGRGVVPEDAGAERVTRWDDFSEADREGVRAHGGDALVACFARRFAEGDWLAVRRGDGGLASWCWVHETSNYAPGGRGHVALLQGAFTLPRFRGSGFLPRTLAFAVRRLERDSPGLPIYIEVAIDNTPSRRGIEKAGFVRVGLRITSPLGERWFRAG